MKKLYTALLFIAICAGLCIYEEVTINEVYDFTRAQIAEALEYANSENYEAAQKSCAVLEKYWNKKYTVLSSMINHTQLDDANLAINSMSDITEEEIEELKEKLAEAKSEIEIIKRNQKISLGNIL